MHRSDPATDLTTLAGVGEKTARTLHKAGYPSVESLLYHLPRAYQDRSNPRTISSLRQQDVTVTVRGQVLSIHEKRYRKRRTLEILLGDGSGVLVLKWFRFNKWLKANLEKRFPPGTQLMATGRINVFAGHLEMHHPDLEDGRSGEGGGIVPVYPIMEGVSQALMRRIMVQAVKVGLDGIKEPLHDEMLEKYGMETLPRSMSALHRPPPGVDVDQLNAGETSWHRRLKFGELLAFQLGVLARRRSYSRMEGIPVTAAGVRRERLLATLGFVMTGAQERAVSEILSDMSKQVPMHRLLQGDVGSGKTLVAFLAMLEASESGHQAMMMAPTEVLAEQHYRNMEGWARATGATIELLTGNTPESARQIIAKGLADGSVDLLVGTHALIQESVSPSSLALAVVDEQHRFGVMQRLALRQKGRRPHLLVMTATPIPRSLSMVVHGDLDISTIDEMPPGRQAVKTEIYTGQDRARLHLDIAREASAGRQAFIVYPLVEESDHSDLMAANEMAENYSRKVFPHLSVDLLTGRMTAAEKEGVMERFRTGETQILVATTVIEVGVDVPNATLMVIEHAERFGLFQLHQLRGRVGRGRFPSRCILVASEKLTEDARRRLRVMVRTNSGFEIAEEDLRIRGPGDLLGTRQAGAPGFRLADPLSDRELAGHAREAAAALYPVEGELTPALRNELEKFWPEGYSLGASG